MRKVLFLCVLLSLFSMNNAIASEVEKMDVPVEQASMTDGYVDGVNYWVTDKHMDYSGVDPYFCYTVHWEYIGNRSNPDQIAYMVYVYNDNYLVTSFLDSAPYGSKVGSKEYKIKVDRQVYYRIEINGSDGSPF